MKLIFKWKQLKNAVSTSEMAATKRNVSYYENVMFTLIEGGGEDLVRLYVSYRYCLKVKYAHEIFEIE